jgi:hypothetical protein
MNMAQEEHDLDHNFNFVTGRRRTKQSPRNQSAERAAEIDDEINTRLRKAMKDRAARKAK